MHSFEELMADIRKGSDLCQAIENEDIICYKKKNGTSKYCGMHISRKKRYKSFSLPIKTIKKCKFIDCKFEVTAKGYCNSHYRKNRLLINPKKCKVEYCGKSVVSKGLCNKHRIRLKRHGDLNANFSHLRYRHLKDGHVPYNKGKHITKICIAPGCEIKNGEPHRFTKGLCKKHHARWIKFGDYNIASKKEFLTKKNSLL